MKINNFWGDLTHVSAKTEALVHTYARCSQRCFRIRHITSHDNAAWFKIPVSVWTFVGICTTHRHILACCQCCSTLQRHMYIIHIHKDGVTFSFLANWTAQHTMLCQRVNIVGHCPEGEARLMLLVAHQSMLCQHVDIATHCFNGAARPRPLVAQ